MASKVQLKRSSVAAKVPLTTDLDYGELSINYTDGYQFYKTSTNTIDSFASISAVATLTNKTITGLVLSGTLTAGGSVGTAGQTLQSTGTGVQWVTGGSGSVTSVSMTVPTGLSVSGTPITTSGTLALTLTAGYSIPTTTSQTNWDTAYTDRNKWDGGATGLVAATGRTSLGATTLGSNLFTLANVAAISFPRINADNTVSVLDAATFRTAIGAGTSSTTGTVTSVSALTIGTTGTDVSSTVATGTTTPVITLNIPTASATNRGALSAADWTTFNNKTSNIGTVTSVGGTGTVSGLSLSGTVTTSGNITLSGTLAVTASNFASQTANTILAAPDGAAGVPTFRNLVLTDLPDAWVKRSVGCATTAALTLNTAQTTIDGVTLAASTRVLVKNQATASQNGIYTNVTTTTWTRAADADTASEIAGAVVNVDAGTINGGLHFDTDFKTTDTLGTTAMAWNRVLDQGYLTTAGNSFATLTNPSAITFLRINADNTVSALDAATFRTAIGAGTSSTTGTVTSVAALTIGTTGTDVTSTVATGTTTPVITLNIPTASATNRGALSAADWTTFNNKTSNTGTVTSVGGTGTVSGLTLTGTVTTSGNLTLGGTLAVTASNFASQTANTVLAAPDNAAGVPTFRNLVLTDLPDAWVKRSVGCATTAALTLNTAQTVIDGVTLTATTRVLIKDQAAPAQNGIYTGVTTTTWVRTTDADTAAEIAGGVVNVDAGTVNGGIHFDTDFKTTDTLGTTAMVWRRVIDTGMALTAGSTVVDGYLRYAGTTATAGQIDGGTTTPTGTTRLNYGGYFYPTSINLVGTADTATTSTHYFVETGTDGFVRPKTLANVQTEIVTTAAVNSAAATTVGTVTSGTWSASFGAVSGANLTNLTAANLAGTINTTVLGNSTLYVGTTAVALNRASANQGLTGISSVTFSDTTVQTTAMSTALAMALA